MKNTNMELVCCQAIKKREVTKRSLNSELGRSPNVKLAVNSLLFFLRRSFSLKHRWYLLTFGQIPSHFQVFMVFLLLIYRTKRRAGNSEKNRIVMRIPRLGDGESYCRCSKRLPLALIMSRLLVLNS